MRKIAILGTAEPHWRYAPFNDPEWEIWTCGGIYGVAPRTDRHIEIHDKAETCVGWMQSPEEEAAARQVYWQWLKDAGERAWLNAHVSDCPQANVYPIEEITAKFGRYFTNTPAYMIALALHEGCTELGLWGIDMALAGNPETGSDEYGQQRPSVEYYLGLAVASGIKLHLPRETTLLKARKLYGFEGPAEDGFAHAMQAKFHELHNREQEIRKFIAHKKAELAEAERDLRGCQYGKEVAGYAQRNMGY